MARKIIKDRILQSSLPLVFAVLVISTAAILIRGAQTEGASSNTIAFLRLAIASICLGLLSFRSIIEEIRRCDARTMVRSALSGIFLAAHFMTWIISLEHISVARSTILVTTSPIWVALLSFIILKETINKKQLFGVLIATGSAFFLFYLTEEMLLNQEQRSIKGELLATLGAISVAAYLIIGRTLRQVIELKVYVFLTYSFATIALILYNLSSIRQLAPNMSGAAWIYIFCLALGPQLIGHTILNWGVRRFPATLVSTMVLAEPIAASALAWVILDEAIGLSSLLGFSGILLGIFLIVRHNKR
ncbi:MAG: DMT family transporter [Proteobacteria bacterium]|nr:DMT family transporter [Pseudomonadota bacterium]MDA1331411.1 DMT family transporter [Pseudomonadota bacterium]